ncbi:MAG: dihydroneopterin aldolase, partial [Jannaschia sp.]
MTADADDRAALRTAFASPLARAEAETGTDLPDRIALREHVREIEIGAFQVERGVAQRVRFDIVAEIVADPAAIAGDDVDGILSYDTLIDAVAAELAATRVDLLETLAERIAGRVLTHDAVARVFVRIGKLDRGPHVLGVEIVRGRDRSAQGIGDSPKPSRPRVV